MSESTLVVITGAQAVGKMTVGQALSRLTGMPLFFNHQIIDLVTPYFPFGTPEYEHVVHNFTVSFMESAARSGRGLIVTWAWRFDQPEDTAELETFIAPFLAAGRVCVAELHAPLEVRLQRNLTENRRAHKRLDWATDEALRDLAERYEFSSGGTLPLDLPHVVLDVTEIPPDESAARIAEAFALSRTRDAGA
jgi:hypothetical protein